MRQIKSDKNFDKKLIKLVRYNPSLADEVETVLLKLEKNVFDKSLKTHKLSGELKKYYSSRINFELRIVFYFDDENVFLVNIGDHDEVY